MRIPSVDVHAQSERTWIRACQGREYDDQARTLASPGQCLLVGPWVRKRRAGRDEFLFRANGWRWKCGLCVTPFESERGVFIILRSSW